METGDAEIRVSLVCVQHHIPVMINTWRLITRMPRALFKDTAAVLFSALFLRLNGGNNNNFFYTVWSLGDQE